MIRTHITAAALLLGIAFASLSARPAHGLPLISEVFYDAIGSDDGLSFVEIFGIPGTLLDGLSLEGVNGANGAVGPVISLTGTIPTDRLFVIADDSGDGTTSVANADLIANFDFQNGPDSILLVFAGSPVDSLGYGVFGAGEIFAGEGTPAPDAPAGSSLARHFANLDSDDNAADFAVLASPSPGTALLLGVPEPQTALTLLAGLSGLAWLGSRRSGAARS